MKLGFLPVAGFAILLVAFLYGFVFIMDNGDLPTGPAINEINNIDIEVEGTPVVDNVEDINYVDGNICVTDNAGTADTELCDTVTIQEHLLLNPQAISIQAGDVGVSANSAGNLEFRTPADLLFVVDNDNTGNASLLLCGTNCLTENQLLQVREFTGITFGIKTQYTPQNVTCTDNGVGASPQTLNPVLTHSELRITNNDPDGCIVTFSETNTGMGQILGVTIVADAGGGVTYPDTPGVQETNGLLSGLSVWDTSTFRYVQDRWVHAGTSNN